MLHHHAELGPDDTKAGHYAAARCSDGERVLVQIGEREQITGDTRQCRLALSPAQALRLAADLLEIGRRPEDARGTMVIGNPDEGLWHLRNNRGAVTIEFRDADRNADPEARLIAEQEHAESFARLILEAALSILGWLPQADRS